MNNRLFFSHIEGLRAVAALLVVFYHLFFDRVSGGVDVFFVLSGFLVMSSLLRHVGQDGKGFKAFFSGLILRLFPLAGVVLLLIFIGSWFLLPEVSLPLVLKETVAAAFYVENWQLAFQQTDYLNREEPPSPIQHFWALSMQAQFYLLSALVIWGVLRFNSRDSLQPRLLMWVFGPLLLASFGYSVYQTHFGNQVWAYFDTFARYWEFVIGCFLAFMLLVRRDLKLPAVLGWIGLIGIVACGFVFQVGSLFPGVTALVPTLCAVLVVLGGRSESPYSVQRLLGSKLLVSLGAVAYGIYLIHWPLLIFYRELVGDQIPWFVGLAIVGLSIGLAYAARYWVELPFIRRKQQAGSSGRRPVGVLLGAATPVVLVAMLAGAASYQTTINQTSGERYSVHDPRYPGARNLTGDADWQPQTELDDFIPDLASVRRSLPRSYDDGCHIRLNASDMHWCAYGDTENYEHTIAVVGGSHSAQWLPALELIAEERRWRIIYSTWSTCRFTSGYTSSSRCGRIYEKAVKELLEIRPDLVFTTANQGAGSISERYIEPWAMLEAAGIQVAAIRDNPWFDTDASRCLSRNVEKPLACSGKRDDLLRSELNVEDAPSNTYVFDLSNYFCNRDICPPVIGSILVWRDRHHLTVPFVQSLMAPLERHLVAAMPVESSKVDETAVARLAKKADGVGASDRRVSVVLACGALGNFPSFERARQVYLFDNHFIMQRGDASGFLEAARTGSGMPDSHPQRFEWWYGAINNDAVDVIGWYNEGSADIKPINFAGSVEDGVIQVSGERGPRECSFSLAQ